MTEQELKIQIEVLDKEYEKAKMELHKKFALEHNPYKIGDIIKDHIGIIKIEKIKGFYFSLGLYKCTYYGTCLTTKLVPFKKSDKRIVYQGNVKEIII